jgi:hypothetical protein
VIDEVKRTTGRKANAKGRSPRKPTSRVFRKVAGCTVTVENPKGLSAEVARAALLEALARLEAEASAGDPVAT